MKSFKIEKLSHNKKVYAIIVRNISSAKNNFFLDNKLDYFQIGYQNLKNQTRLKSHRHKKRNSQIKKTDEIIYMISGKMKVFFYDDLNNLFSYKIIKKDDLIYLKYWGHGFKILSNDTKFFEVKQGPYKGISDKIFI